MRAARTAAWKSPLCIQTHTSVERTNYPEALMNGDLNHDVRGKKMPGGWKDLPSWKTHVIISDCSKGKTHSIQPASLHTPESSQLQRRSQRGFTFLHHAVHTGKWLSTTSTPITRQGQRDWMNLQNCQICGSGCAAPGIRFQGFYVLFMHAYRSMPFIVPSLHNSSEKLSCKLTSDLAIKKKCYETRAEP